MAKIMEFPKMVKKPRRAARQSKLWKQSKEWVYWIGAIYMADVLAYLTISLMGN